MNSLECGGKLCQGIMEPTNAMELMPTGKNYIFLGCI